MSIPKKVLWITYYFYLILCNFYCNLFGIEVCDKGAQCQKEHISPKKEKGQKLTVFENGCKRQTGAKS